MDWKDVGRVIAPMAPALGGILGGLIPFPGASLMGSAIGNIIAKQFGVEPTPAAVSEAVLKSQDQVVIAKLNAATEEARIKINGFVEAEKAYYATVGVSLAETGKTMRVELEHQHWFFTGWRPSAGWLFDIFSAAFGVQLVMATLQAVGGNPLPLRTLVDAWPAYLALLGPLALMVGVYVIGRSTEKAAAISSTTPTTTVNVKK